MSQLFVYNFFLWFPAVIGLNKKQFKKSIIDVKIASSRIPVACRFGAQIEDFENTPKGKENSSSQGMKDKMGDFAKKAALKAAQNPELIIKAAALFDSMVNEN